MRKTFTVLLIFGLLAGAFMAPAEAAKKKKKAKPRTAETRYEGPGYGVAPFGGFCSPGISVGCVEFATGPEEQWVVVEITDDIGPSTYGVVGQDPDGDNSSERGGEFCKKTDEAIQIQPGVPITVFVWNGRCSTAEPSIVTTGTVKATFYSSPPVTK